MSRAVFDTNVLVSAYVFGGAPAELLRGVIRAEYELVTSPALLAELARVLADKFEFDAARVEAVIQQLARISTICRPTLRLTVIADDPDNRVLECATASSADLIVTDDSHLLGLSEYQDIPIAKPASAVKRLRR